MSKCISPTETRKIPSAPYKASPKIAKTASIDWFFSFSDRSLLRADAPYPRLTLFVYAKCMLDEKDFQRKADAAFEDLKRRMLTAGDEHGFDVEGESGKLEVIFEEPAEATFVISP